MKKIGRGKPLQEITSGGHHPSPLPPPAAPQAAWNAPRAPAPPAWAPPPGAPAWGAPQAHAPAPAPLHRPPEPPPGPPPGAGAGRGMSQGLSRGIIKQQVVGAYGQAKEILAVAEQEAARIIQDAERLREEQARLGWEQGHRQAYEEALARLGEIEGETQKLFEDLEPKVIELAVKVAEKIIGAELRARPDAIAEIVAQALRTVRHQKEIVVRVHPSHADDLERNKKTLLGVLSRAREVQIRGDPTVREGGCVVETELGMLDADLKTQLEILERALMGGLPKKEAEEEALPDEIVIEPGPEEQAEEEEEGTTEDAEDTGGADESAEGGEEDGDGEYAEESEDGSKEEEEEEEG